MHFEWSADRTACVITQPLKVAQLIDSANLRTCRPSYTPGVPNVLVSDKDCPHDDDAEHIALMKDRRTQYKSRVGQLLWLARTSMPQIAYQVNALMRSDAYFRVRRGPRAAVFG